MSLRIHRPHPLLLLLLTLAAPVCFATARNADWMRWLPDSASLATLSLPGTHDTMANQADGVVGVDLNWVLTQSMELRPQLDAGIRVLDIRARHIGDRFTIHHGAYYVQANFDEVLSTSVQFLREHPAETLLMRVKQEHTTEYCSRSFIDTFRWYRDQPAYSGFIWRGTHIPTLGEVRGKIVILDEFSGGAYGINWNALAKQDAWEEANTDAKWGLVRNHLEAADNGSRDVLYVNFLSASSIMGGNCADPFPLYGTPRCIAKVLNAELHNYLVDGDGQRTGAVMMDFPEMWLMDAIIPLNSQGGIPSARGNNGQYEGVGTTLEVGIDRPGMDYMDFALQEARPELCREACFADAPRCQAFAYVKPGVLGLQPRCYLKSGIPTPTLNPHTVAGTTLTNPHIGLISGLVETNVDRPGLDYKRLELPEARPELCREVCLHEADVCKSFTYVRPGPGSPTPVCYLKHGVPDPVPSAWCDSGLSSKSSESAPLEYNMDRPGMDYKAFELPPDAAPEQCRDACLREPQFCKSFTAAWSLSDAGDFKLTCYLKFGVPEATYNFWTVSGVRPLADNEYTVGTTIESGIDRIGMDYKSFELPEARPALCRKACFDDSSVCKAFTYAKPGVHGTHARCFLKSGIPAPVLNPNTESGTTQSDRGVGFSSGLVETNVNRFGQDYRNFEMGEARPELCREACINETQCRAFSYVKPGVLGTRARCYLKSGVPAPVPDAGSDSGVIPRP